MRIQHAIYAPYFFSLSSIVFEVLKTGALRTFLASFSSLKKPTAVYEHTNPARDKQKRNLTRIYAALKSGLSQCFKRARVTARSKAFSLMCGNLYLWNCRFELRARNECYCLYLHCS
jgi:hypothetical protein